MDVVDLANAIVLAAEIREDSFTEEPMREAMRNGKPLTLEMFYKKSYAEAADTAVTETGLSTKMTRIVELLIRKSTLEVKGWANYVLEG